MQTPQNNRQNERPEAPTDAQVKLIRRFRYTGPIKSKQHAAEIIDRLLTKKKGGAQ